MTEEVKRYEAGDVHLLFLPEKRMEGTLEVRYPEHEPYTAHLSLSKPQSRKRYAKEAAEHRELDRELVEKLLVDLCSKRVEEIEAATEAESQAAGSLEPVPEVSQGEIDALVGAPDVLNRFVEDSATCSGVIGERDLLRLQALGALSAQLEPMPNGTPLGVNVMLSGSAGRGKNHICSAIARLLPEEFYHAFESSSGKAFYYAAENNTAFLKHHWLYPNEAEGVDLLIELLRPLISGGRARHMTVNKDEKGRNVFQEFELEGPISSTIPTIRNKLDKQLGTRMLIAGLEDYQGRVAAHSRAVSDQLSVERAGVDHAPVIDAWQAALRSLTGVRRVVVPRRHPEFCFDSDQVTHGARLWTNVMGLMCAHAWLEQRNRERRTLGNGEEVVIAQVEDYEAAYEIFRSTCERSVHNISGTQRTILEALHQLQAEQQHDAEVTGDYSHAYEPFSQRGISDECGVPQSTISDNKAYLVQSLKFVQEFPGGGLRLVKGAHPSWWERDDALDGFPRPVWVRELWHGEEASEDDVRVDDEMHSFVDFS